MSLRHSPEYLAAVGQKRVVRLWVSRLRRLIRDAPDGVVALVHPSSIEIYDAKELRAYEDKNGHRDNPTSLVTILETGSAFEPNSESV
jgi:hypothetical protein